MSLSIIQQPSTANPIPKSEPLFWYLQSDDFVTSEGVKAEFSVEFQDYEETPFIFCIVKGVGFTTSDVAPFTVDTFKSEAIGALTAVNFGAMLAINPNFADFVIKVQGAKVTVTSTKAGTLSPWSFVFGSFVVPPTVVQANGVAAVYAQDFVFWDLYEGSTRIVGRNKNDFTPGTAPNGFCSIEFDQYFLFSRYEPKTNLVWWPEDNFWIDCQFRAYRTRQNIVCQQTAQDGAFGNYTLVNSLFQVEETVGFEIYSGDLPRKWITGNPIERVLPNNFFEIVGIWLENRGEWREINPFAIEMKVTLMDDTVELIGNFPNPAHKFWFVPTGTLNGSYIGLLELGIKKVEVQVFAYPEVGERVAYSEVLTRTFSNVNDDCKKQVIFLGDRGSFDTFLIGEELRDRQEVEGLSRDLARTRSFEDQVRQLRTETSIRSVNLAKTYRSEPINGWNIDFVKQLERSPQVYRIIENEEGYLLEQVRMAKGSFVNVDTDGLPVLEFEFFKATDMKFHK